MPIEYTFYIGNNRLKADADNEYLKNVENLFKGLDMSKNNDDIHRLATDFLKKLIDQKLLAPMTEVDLASLHQITKMTDIEDIKEFVMGIPLNNEYLSYDFQPIDRPGPIF